MSGLKQKAPDRSLALVLLIMTGCLGLAYWASNAQGYRINPTPSLPQGIWQQIPLSQPLQRGQIVFVCLPPSALSRQAKDRGYLYYGNCPGGYAPLLKPVAAVPGDIVTMSNQGIRVNGQWLPNSVPSQGDSQQRPLTAVPSGRYVVKPGTVWLISTYYAQSFDSRYFGPVPIHQIQGTAKPVWLWHTQGESFK